MSFVQTDSDLWAALESIITDEGLLLYDAMRISSNSLRVFIERANVVEDATARRQGGVTSEDCSRICRRLMVVLAAEGRKWGFDEEPEIEVSSPGINRHLRLPRHFTSAVGEHVKVSYATNGGAAEDSRSVVGRIMEISNETLRLKGDHGGEEIVFPLRDVSKARIDFQF